MLGILNLNKPPRWTSRDAVNRVQRAIKTVTERPHPKVGHAGTLDPLATGVLVLCVGPATRLIEYVQQMPKIYRGTFLLGQSSASEDTDSEVTHHQEVPQPTRDQIVAALPPFLGQIMQRPPAFSALKVKGERAYALARRGQEVELPPRPVTIHDISLRRYAYPELELTIRCGSGTYVRSLGRDLAAALGTHAVMSALVRTAIGQFTLDEAIDPHLFEPNNHGMQQGRGALEEHLRDPLLALTDLPKITLSELQQQEVMHGREILLPSDHDPRLLDREQNAPLVAVDEQGRLFALLKSPRAGHLRAFRNFR